MRDANACLEVIGDHELDGATKVAAELLALVAGQDVAEDADGVFRIVRGVAKDRVISTVDTEARHGHKSKNRHFDGYKAHLSIDPDSELIAEVVATPANTHDATPFLSCSAEKPDEDKPIILGDSAYADGQTREELGEAGFTVMAKCPPIRNATGGFTKDRFVVDLEANTVTCPAGHTGDHPTTRRQRHALRSPLCELSAASRLHDIDRRVARSPSTNTRRFSNKPEPSSAIRSGSPPIGRTDHSSSARSPTSSNGPGADDEGGPGDCNASPPISTREREHQLGPSVLGLIHVNRGWAISASPAPSQP